jgi:hypothetical protein
MVLGNEPAQQPAKNQSFVETGLAPSQAAEQLSSTALQSNAVLRKLTNCHPSMYLYGVSPMV